VSGGRNIVAVAFIKKTSLYNIGLLYNDENRTADQMDDGSGGTP